MSSEKMSKEEFLKAVKIDNITDLKDEHFIKVASYIDKLEPEVAKAVIGQYPEFANTVKGACEQYSSTVKSKLGNSRANCGQALDIIQTTIDALNSMLKTEGLTFEQKMLVIEKIENMHDRVERIVNDSNSDDGTTINKETGFLLGALALVAAVFGFKFYKK